MIERILPLFRDVLNDVYTLVQGVHFTSTNPQHLLSGALLGRVLEIAEGIYVMLERRDGACAYILLRSLLEVHIDLRNLVKEPGYEEFMHATWLKQQKDALERVIEKGSTSSFLISIAGNDDAKAHLNWVRSTLSELKRRNISPLSIRERFERAEQLDYYEGPYNDLSWNTHSNLNVLEKRHLRFSNHGAEIRAFDPISDTDAQIISDTTAGIVANSLVAARQLVPGDSNNDELKYLTEKLAKFRALWPSDEGE